MRYISADYILLPERGLTKNVVLLIDSQGEIQDIIYNTALGKKVEYYDGIIGPGFVNAHCHLELSHMKDEIPTGTGLIPFIKTVVSQRNKTGKDISKEIKDADEYMYRKGIQAVGDISNLVDSFPTKEKSKISYSTFIEAFDFFNPAMTEDVFENAVSIFSQLNLKSGDYKSIVPHAPYSTSSELMKKIDEFNQDSSATISIHNQETPAENEFLMTGSGPFKEFYKEFGIDISSYTAPGYPAVLTVRDNFSNSRNIILVHNTKTSEEDVNIMKEWSDNLFWCTCPNANLYIENKLPDYKMLIDSGVTMCIGTDSLSSNWQLDIWEEIKTIRKYNSWISIESMLFWATQNGAIALGMDSTIGTLEIGAHPGLVHINLKSINDNKSIEASTATRIL